MIIEGEYRTPAQEHAYLQPEAGLGYIDEEGRVTVVVAGQWTHEDQEQIAHALGLPLEQVRVIYPPSAAHLAGGRICRCRSSWPWRPGGCTSAASTAR